MEEINYSAQKVEFKPDKPDKSLLIFQLISTFAQHIHVCELNSFES